jgi:cardiolipin synthase
MWPLARSHLPLRSLHACIARLPAAAAVHPRAARATSTAAAIAAAAARRPAAPAAGAPAPAPAPADPRDSRVLTLPNAMTLARLALSPYLSHLVLAGRFGSAGALLAALAALDAADGWVARTFDQESKLGSYLDPLADKAMLVCAAAPLALAGGLPLPLVALWAARDGAVVAGGLYLRAVTRPPGVPFFHMTHASVPTVEPTGASKANTALQAALAAAGLAGLWAAGAAAGGGAGGAEAAAGLEALLLQALPAGAAASAAFEGACWVSAAGTLGTWVDYAAKQREGLRQWRTARAAEEAVAGAAAAAEWRAARAAEEAVAGAAAAGQQRRNKISEPH